MLWWLVLAVVLAVVRTIWPPWLTLHTLRLISILCVLGGGSRGGGVFVHDWDSKKESYHYQAAGCESRQKQQLL